MFSTHFFLHFLWEEKISVTLTGELGNMATGLYLATNF
jgi:hypothetical protein